jgi:lysylphosphatidylglycerol synthetase-like protein (DUF2156 family)
MIDWQEIIVLGIAAVAAVYVVRAFYREWRGMTQSGCAACILRKYRRPW